MGLGLVNFWLMLSLSIKCDRGRSENLGGRAEIEVYLIEHLQESDWSLWEFAPPLHWFHFTLVRITMFSSHFLSGIYRSYLVLFYRSSTYLDMTNLRKIVYFLYFLCAT